MDTFGQVTPASQFDPCNQVEDSDLAVQDTILTRIALRWKLFSEWCALYHPDPVLALLPHKVTARQREIPVPVTLKGKSQSR